MYNTTAISNESQSVPAALYNKAMSPQQPGLTAPQEHLPIQLKLSVGAVNDPLEDEADAMADKVMRMPETSFIQRKAGCGCSCCDQDDEHVRLKPMAGQVTPFIQAKSDGGGAVSDSVSSRVKSSMGGGSPMQSDTRSFMESRFGTGFGDIKIHNNDESAQLNRSLNAKAFTVSNNIYFNNGQYQPETDAGKHLLAHELTHVVQQGSDVKIRRKENNADNLTVKIKWQGTVFASLYYFIRPALKNEEEAKQIVNGLLLNNSFIYYLNNGKNASQKDFEYVENFQKTQTIIIYEGALKIILDATGYKSKKEFFNVLETNKVIDQKVSQLINELKASNIDIPYQNSWLDSFILGVGQSSLGSKFSEAYSKMKENATSWENGPAFYTGTNVGFSAGVVEDLWENVKGIFLLAWQLIKAQFEITTDPLGFYNKMKHELLNIWQVICADPTQLGLLAGNALAEKITKDFVKVNSFNQGFALGEMLGKIATEIALLFVGVEEVSALAKAAEGTKIGGLILKSIKESETIGKVGQLLKGEKGIKAAEDSSKALTETQKLEEAVRLAQKAEGESKPSQELLKLEESVLQDKLKDPEHIELTKDAALPEVKVADHSYKRNTNNHWCRFSTENCDIALGPGTTEALDKAVARKSIVTFDNEMKNAIIGFWEDQKKLPENADKIKNINKYIENIKKGDRPTWRQSEREMEFFYSRDGIKQKPYINARAAEMRTPKHVRPDLILNETAVEVKNYKIENKQNLINKLTEQIKRRRSMEGLPYDIKQQAIIIDLRGQKVTDSEIINLTIEIQQKTEVPFENIQVLQWPQN